ncbi:sugar phosphate nucleotidyltransferase [Flagellimonas meishanensis]|uniref:sugar phosphate nucleotidyltransferase n=1 Tax=Flagellimonas meishanensis TaxID=2873264 RepID=UPI001CA6170A|nr:sugar phosphate nucleotidyltransferase [[Muricauda] meishanensis]
MENKSLVIMAGGASSRMKKSLEELSDHKKVPGDIYHKSLIPVGKNGTPFLYYLVKNAWDAGYTHLYLITGPENQPFRNFVRDNMPFGFKTFFAIQHIPAGRKKPLGTADALQQCMDQFPELNETLFTVCNGDNLYSVRALHDLRKDRKTPNALISYASSGFDYKDERISKFAVMEVTDDGFLKRIIEKPEKEQLSNYKDSLGEIRVSMNIFSFYGKDIYPFIRDCPLDPVRDEKELPKAVANMVHELPDSVLCIPRSEPIPDLTSAADIPILKKME